MPRYKVTVKRTVEEAGTVWVNAYNERDAVTEAAKRMASPDYWRPARVVTGNQIQNVEVEGL